MPGLLGKKIGMTSVFSADGKNVPCTVIEAGPCVVTQIKSVEKDGYAAVQVGFQDKKEKHTTKPLMGHFKKAGVTPKRHLAEFKDFETELNLGDTITVEDTGRKVTLNESIFGIEPNDHAIYLDVKQFMANQRQGTHKSKERSEISGSTRKLGRQKGGGGARRGDINSPVLVGGARVFGPKPRDYWFKLNKKVKTLARKSALSYKAQENAIIIVEDFTFEAPKTKDFVSMVNNLKIADKKLLLVLPEANKNVYLSARNIERANVAIASALNTYNVLNAETLVVTENSLKAIENILS